mmetsp:Transcript_17611/g.35073  ORF Transcript_17611/g.35073 Transcript_17611/m.35073 type:complete len:103 (+) Transcript_17611:23-331(+)|eukprot:CAMPEP_0194303254 /NCGR_PEP_ID=MMETSP0171-20130528/1155_1 /TAXON_ID=218684 /ORGANISM="Corethron pennatum, Strain L29A3" /LENGTH=102 /DNA_ID=CAMNT_0039054081 /DNA_START=27 /DNA_END=335 /DNA_ORIENTATION=+
MVQQKRSAGKVSLKPLRASPLLLLLALYLVAPSRSFSASRAPLNRRHPAVPTVLGAEVDRRGAIAGGLLSGYAVFELSGGAKKLQDSTGIGIGKLKNATLTE